MAHRPQASVVPERTYSISAAAQLAGAGVQSVRLYEARGLVTPRRTAGGTRKYSPADVARIERIVVLLDAGLNLAGIEMVLHLEEENHRLWSASIPYPKSEDELTTNAAQQGDEPPIPLIFNTRRQASQQSAADL